MPATGFSGAASGSKIDVAIDTGNPVLNLTIDGFLKIGAVGVAKAAVEETYHILNKGSVSKSSCEDALTKMCKEGAYWGTAAGLYVGLEYGMERIRGTRDWKNAMLGGVLTGAILSAASNKDRDKVVMDAIAGGAIATAAEFLNCLT